MKTTGIVGRIDDLGRIVIPKDIRRTLKNREGESSFIRIVNWEYSDVNVCSVYDLSFDNSKYTLSWVGNCQRVDCQYQYRKHFADERELNQTAQNIYEYYVLVNNEITALFH